VTYLAERNGQEGSSACSFNDNSQELGVDSTEVCIPRILGDPDVVVALISFLSLAEDMTELRSPNN
jgi:hypothetical protein